MKRFAFIVMMLTCAVTWHVLADDAGPLGGGVGGFPDDDHHGDCELGDDWDTVDRVRAQFDGAIAQVYDLTANDKIVIAAGERRDKDLHSQWLVRRSKDRGNDWETVENGLNGFPTQSIAFGAGSGPRGELYVAGTGTDAQQNFHWITRKSTDNGRTWKTVDDYAGAGGTFSPTPKGVVVDGKGNIYVTGSEAHNVGSAVIVHLITRRSTNGGATWSTVDDFNLETNQFAVGESVAATRSGKIFAAGRANTATLGLFWIVRYTEDGVNWTNVDIFQRPGGHSADARGVAISPDQDEVVVTGESGEGAGNRPHWITRKARTQSPASWKTIDDFLGEGSSAIAVGGAAVFSKESEIFTAGAFSTGFNPGDFNFYAARREKFIGPGFVFTDTLRRTVGNQSPGTFSQAATRDKPGDLFTGGMVAGDWIIRRLKCD